MDNPRQRELRKIMRIVITFKSKRCPRCEGIMTLELDHKAGYTRECLNCGRIEYLNISPNRPSPLPGRNSRTEGWHIIRPQITSEQRR